MVSLPFVHFFLKWQQVWVSGADVIAAESSFQTRRPFTRTTYSILDSQRVAASRNESTRIESK